MTSTEQALHGTVFDYLNRWAQECPERIWLRDRRGDEFSEWSWRAARDERAT